MAGERETYPHPAEWAVARLRRGITQGEFPPNSHLPGERGLAERLGVGRSTLRDALARLEELRFVERSPNRGTRVLTAAERLGEKPVGVVYRRLQAQERPERVSILEGVQDQLHELGYPWRRITYEDPAGGTGQTPAGAVRPEMIPALADECAGLVFVEGGNAAMLAYAQELEDRRYPVVAANQEFDCHVTGSWVDHAKATRQAVQTLVAFGHRRIGFVGRDRDAFFYGKTEDAYRAAVAEAGLDLDERLIAIADATNALSAYLVAQPLLNGPAAPTAVVAARDALAHGVCRAVEESGRRVGHDVSVIGFDDLTWPCEAPYLTTFREPCHDMGAVAVRMLVERLIDGWKAPEKREIEAPFVLRRSAGPAPLPDNP